jgi:hypothetical protein
LLTIVIGTGELKTPLDPAVPCPIAPKGRPDPTGPVVGDPDAVKVSLEIAAVMAILSFHAVPLPDAMVSPGGRTPLESVRSCPAAMVPLVTEATVRFSLFP